MLASKSRSKYVGIAMLTLLVLTLAPISIGYADKPEDKPGEKRAEKFVELAEKAGEKVEDYIDLIYANKTANQTIADAGLYDELKGNETLFETWGMGNLTKARVELEAGNYEAAVANATQALSIFREVFKALNTILREAEVEKGQLTEAQGLIEAMKRDIETIERLNETAPAEIWPILKSALSYLNLTEARRLLLEGRVNETAWNKTQANKLISLAHSLLKKKAEELNIKRIESYLKVIEKFYDRLERSIDKAVERGISGAEDLKTDLLTVKPLIDGARDAFAAGDYGQAISKLVQARNALKEIEGALQELRLG